MSGVCCALLTHFKTLKKYYWFQVTNKRNYARMKILCAQKRVVEWPQTWSLINFPEKSIYGDSRSQRGSVKCGMWQTTRSVDLSCSREVTVRSELRHWTYLLLVFPTGHHKSEKAVTLIALHLMGSLTLHLLKGLFSFSLKMTGSSCVHQSWEVIIHLEGYVVTGLGMHFCEEVKVGIISSKHRWQISQSQSVYV